MKKTTLAIILILISTTILYIGILYSGFEFGLPAIIILILGTSMYMTKRALKISKKNKTTERDTVNQALPLQTPDIKVCNIELTNSNVKPQKYLPVTNFIDIVSPVLYQKVYYCQKCHSYEGIEAELKREIITRKTFETNKCIYKLKCGHEKKVTFTKKNNKKTTNTKTFIKRKKTKK